MSEEDTGIADLKDFMSTDIRKWLRKKKMEAAQALKRARVDNEQADAPSPKRRKEEDLDFYDMLPGVSVRQCITSILPCRSDPTFSCATASSPPLSTLDPAVCYERRSQKALQAVHEIAISTNFSAHGRFGEGISFQALCAQCLDHTRVRSYALGGRLHWQPAV